MTEESCLLPPPQCVETETIKYLSSRNTNTTGCITLSLIMAEAIHLFFSISKRMTGSRYWCPMQAMNGYADVGVIPLISKLCNRWTRATSSSSCFASSAEYHNTVKKTLVVLQKRYVLRKTLLYLETVHSHFLSNPLNFLQPDHPVTYITHCINTADGNKVLYSCYRCIGTDFF